VGLASGLSKTVDGADQSQHRPLHLTGGLPLALGGGEHLRAESRRVRGGASGDGDAGLDGRHGRGTVAHDPGAWKVEPFWEVGPMEGAAGSDEVYALDQVPYHMYFNWREALHGFYWHDNFGYDWLHGCVNLSVSDAKWLWDNWVVQNTRVVVYDEKLG
jgi:hypothetical protein